MSEPQHNSSARAFAARAHHEYILPVPATGPLTRKSPARTPAYAFRGNEKFERGCAKVSVVHNFSQARTLAWGLAGSLYLGVWCTTPELGQAAGRRGNHYQPGSTHWLLCKLQFRTAYMKERRSKSVALIIGHVKNDMTRRRRHEVNECVMHGQLITELKTPRTRLQMRHDPGKNSRKKKPLRSSGKIEPIIWDYRI